MTQVTSGFRIAHSPKGREPVALVFISNDRPRPTGGPLGIAHILIRAAKQQFVPESQHTTFIVADNITAPLTAVQSDQENLGLPCRRTRRIYKHIHQLQATLELLLRYDSIHFLQFGPARSAILLRLLGPVFRKKVRYVYTEHSKGGVHVEMRRAGRPLPLQLLRKADLYLTMRLASAVIWPSRAALDGFLDHNRWRWLEAKSRVVYSAVSVSAERNLRPPGQPEVVSIVTVAQQVPEKNVPSVIRAFTMFRERGHANATLTLIGGPGADGGTVRQLLDDKTVASVICLGQVPARVCHSVLRNSDIFVLVPEVAVFDLSLLEAMGYGLAVISSRVGGNPEALGEDYPGFVRDIDDLVEVLERLTSDPELRRLWGDRNQRRYRERFSDTAQMLRSYVEIAKG